METIARLAILNDFNAESRFENSDLTFPVFEVNNCSAFAIAIFSDDSASQLNEIIVSVSPALFPSIVRRPLRCEYFY